MPGQSTTTRTATDRLRPPRPASRVRKPRVPRALDPGHSGQRPKGGPSGNWSEGQGARIASAEAPLDGGETREGS